MEILDSAAAGGGGTGGNEENTSEYRFISREIAASVCAIAALSVLVKGGIALVGYSVRMFAHSISNDSARRADTLAARKRSPFVLLVFITISLSS